MTRSRSKSTPASDAKAKSKARMEPAPVLIAHGWNLWFHPCVLQQLEKVVTKARLERARRKRPGEDSNPEEPNTKLLARLWSLIRDEIPQDPGSSRYRLGRTLGDEYKHWHRAKTGNGRYRLFFRYGSASRTIIFGWVNDEHSLRSYGASTDAYKVFRERLARGTPPDDWDTLLAECKKDDALAEASRLVPGQKT